ncbi:MAG: NAD-dependent epimerase/dehydratase family protein [Phycisphaerae bacterium]
MRLFVTGAAGRLGSRALKRFAASHEIVAFDRADPPPSLPAGVRYVQADLRDAGAVRRACAGCEAVVHLAAIPGRLPTIPQAEIFAINTQGTYHVLEAADRAGARIVVLAGSLCAIGLPTSFENHGVAYLPIDEDHPCRPNHAYDLSKRLNELTAETFSRLTGVSTICLRFPALIDVCHDGWFAKEVRRPSPRLVLGDYLDFSDAVSVLEAALHHRDLRHELLFVNAETIGTATPTPQYVQRFNPRIEWRGPTPTATTPLINCARLKRVLNFTPAVSWQQAMAESGSI